MHCITVQAIASPTKGATPYTASTFDFKSDSVLSGPFADEAGQSLSSLITGRVHDPNEALIHKLLESLQSLKTSDSREDSGANSPSPLTASTGGSIDPIPSTPTDYDVR